MNNNIKRSLTVLTMGAVMLTTYSITGVQEVKAKEFTMYENIVDGISIDLQVREHEVKYDEPTKPQAEKPSGGVTTPPTIVETPSVEVEEEVEAVVPSVEEEVEEEEVETPSVEVEGEVETVVPSVGEDIKDEVEAPSDNEDNKQPSQEDESTIKERVYSKEELVKEIDKAQRLRIESFNIIYSGSEPIDNDIITKIYYDRFAQSGYLNGVSTHLFTYINRGKGFKGDGNDIVNVRNPFHTTHAEDEFVYSEATRLSKGFIQENMSEFEKTKAIYDYIVNNYTYKTDTIGKPGNPYTFMKEGGGVCSGYATTMAMFLDVNGIENVYVIGEATHGTGNWAGWSGHEWNKVKVDGEWYNLDPTWGYPNSEYNAPTGYRYFLSSDSKFSSDHRLDDYNKFIMPEATSTKYDQIHR